MVLGFSLLVFASPAKVLAENYNEIYIFGDSLSDTGNVLNITNGAIPSSPTYFNGRFSNGITWVEYLSSDLGIMFNPKNNFAVGGATTGIGNIALRNLTGLQKQVESFKEANPSADPKALYIIWAGTNDYLDYFFGGVPNPSESGANLSAAIKSLTDVGAKNIMVVNLPDLGKFPVANADSKNSTILTNFSNAHNSSLTTNLKFLRQQLKPDVHLINLDVNSLFNRFIDTPQEFGFTNALDSCIPRNLSVFPVDVPTRPVRCTPNTFLFYDEVHPTTAAHKLIGEYALFTLKSTSVPEANSVLGLLALSVSAVVLQLLK